MANTRKPKTPPSGPRRKRTTKPASEQAPTPDAQEWEALSPDRLRQLWEMHHPGRPEVRSMLERLYRQRY
jgi:hypothetical protein